MCACGRGRGARKWLCGSALSVYRRRVYTRKTEKKARRIFTPGDRGVPSRSLGPRVRAQSVVVPMPIGRIYGGGLSVRERRCKICEILCELWSSSSSPAPIVSRWSSSREPTPTRSGPPRVFSHLLRAVVFVRRGKTQRNATCGFFLFFIATRIPVGKTVYKPSKHNKRTRYSKTDTLFATFRIHKKKKKNHFSSRLVSINFMIRPGYRHRKSYTYMPEKRLAFGVLPGVDGSNPAHFDTRSHKILRFFFLITIGSIGALFSFLFSMSYRGYNG